MSFDTEFGEDTGHDVHTDPKRAIDEMVEEARENQSYFDDPEDLDKNAEESWARIERDPTMAQVMDVDPTNFDRFIVDDDEFTTRAMRVEHTLAEMGIDYANVEIGDSTYERLESGEELHRDHVSVFYLSTDEEPGSLLDTLPRPDTDGIDDTVVLTYGRSGYDETVPVEVDADVDHMDLRAPTDDAYRRRNESEMNFRQTDR